MYLSYVCDTSRCGPFRVNADENNNAYYTVLRFDANARARECQNGCRYEPGQNAGGGFAKNNVTGLQRFAVSVFSFDLQAKSKRRPK